MGFRITFSYTHTAYTQIILTPNSLPRFYFPSSSQSTSFPLACLFPFKPGFCRLEEAGDICPTESGGLR